MYDFVFVSLQRIGTDRDSTSTNLARELARNHRVLYVNAPVDRKSYHLGGDNPFVQAHIDELKSGSGKKLKQLDENLWMMNPARLIESINWIPFTPLFRFLNKRNNVILSEEIKAVIDQLGFKDIILINDKDMFRSFYLKELLLPKKYAYLDRDYTVAMPYWKRHGASIEPELMAKADLVLCNSTGFQNRAKQYNPQSFYIGNGCDVELFDGKLKHDVPEELSTIKGPVIGYIGAIIALRLDERLMLEVAESRPGYSFVFVGPQDEVFKRSRLHDLENVHFLGKKDTRLAPAYIQHFDVGINPQALNPITQYNYPLKVDEYLSMGIPVVATETETMRDVFIRHSYLANDARSFSEAIDRALRENSPEKKLERMAFASGHSWKKVSDDVLNFIES